MDKTVEPMTDDAELAKVLEGMQDAVSTPAPAPATAQAASGLAFESTAPTVDPAAAQACYYPCSP
jgi:hypothetical protein